MQVKCCRFFLWHDRPIDDECAKAFISELRTGNKELAKTNMLLKNENKALMKMVVELKTENECLKKMSYAHISEEDLCDEIVTLKAEIEVVATKLKYSMLESIREAKAKKCTNSFYYYWANIIVLASESSLLPHLTSTKPFSKS